MFCSELWYSVEKYSIVDAAIQLSAYMEQHISKRNHDNTTVQEIHISRLELQDGMVTNLHAAQCLIASAAQGNIISMGQKGQGLIFVLEQYCRN
jgi:hypothetical protein